MRWAALGIVVMALAVTLWACDSTPAATPSVTLSSIVPEPSPAPTPKPETPAPTPTLTPTPTPTSVSASTPAAKQEPWTPGPLVAAEPLPSPSAREKLIFDDFIVVKANGREGVVDKYGREVLPAIFAHVEIVNYDFGGEYWAGEHAFPPRGRILFFAIPTQYNGVKYDPKRRLGWLFDTQCKRVGNGEYNEVCFIGEHVLRVWVDKGEEPGCGAITDKGEVLVPLNYDSVEMIDDRIVASSSREDITDLYTAGGRKVKTVKGALPFSDRVSVGQGKYLKGIDFNRPNGEEEVLIDRDLRVVLYGEAYSIDWLAPDRFTVRREGETGVVDSADRVIVPLRYETVTLEQIGKKSYFCAGGPNGCGLYDLDGKEIYYSTEHTDLRPANDHMIVGDGRWGRVLSLDGRDLLGRDDVEDWLPEAGLYRCVDSGNRVTLVREDGTELPLPRSDSIEALGSDRFLVGLNDNEIAVLDSKGNTIIPGVQRLDRVYDMDNMDGALLYTSGEGAQQRVWLLDDNGNSLWREPVDSAEPVWHTELFKVRAGPRYGLMDKYGRWVWSASDYDALDD